MANIHFIGVGKSLVARLLAQYLIDKDISFTGFDTDRSHGALMRFYAGFAAPILVDRFEALDAIVEAAVDQPERRVLIDLAAQTFDPLVKWMDESEVLSLAGELGFTINYWHVMDTGKDSVDLLKRLLDRFADRMRYILVLNQIRGDDFSILKDSGELARAEGLGARVVSIKRLHDGVITKIEAASSSFWAAKNPADKSGSTLGLMERQRVKAWLRDAYQEIDNVGV